MRGAEINSLEDVVKRVFERDAKRESAKSRSPLPLFGLPHAPDIGLHLGKERDDEWKRKVKK